MNEINFKKFYPMNLEKIKNQINNFWNQALKEVRDERIFELTEKALQNKALKVNEVTILLFNIKKVDNYLMNKKIELYNFITKINFDLSEKKIKRKECIMDIYQAIVSYFNKNEVETALNIFVEDNITLEDRENEIIEVYKWYRESQKDYIVFLYDEIIKAIKNNNFKETLEKFYISEEREVFSYIMDKILLDIVSFVKFQKTYIEEILADFFDRVKHEVRIESFKRILSYYAEEYKQTEDIGICSRVIMEKIHGYLKDPHKNSPKWQWGEFNEEQIEIMRIWHINKDLEKYFSLEVNDKIRLEFWRRYIKYIKEVKYFERLKQAIVMLTDEHIFIEFGEKGNAAYGYKKGYISFDEIARLSRVTKLKNPQEKVLYMKHSGYWEVKLKSILHKLGYSIKVWR
ncbi:hypothetical protein [Fusobacterium nucleatum]|uniref:hypothetical protein n=1 Tax=Fusobacterium nucleatum TaxID=851 RepID=UPI0025CCE98A|nr:hypothetical protein [uncultured Fusobacterium sp.]